MTWHEVASSSTVVSKESMIPASQLVDVSEVKKHNHFASYVSNAVVGV